MKNYYAIIPANVRYDNDLTANAKLLYGEITALTNEKGYCWATNNYFAELYNTSDRTIRRWISQLSEKGYIVCELFYKEGSKEVEERRITLGAAINTTPGQKCPEGTDKNVRGGEDKNVRDNNTVFNNTSIYNDLVSKELAKMYPGKSCKATRDKKLPSILKKYGIEEIKRVIGRYAKEVAGKDKQYILNESTFWNGRFVDYLDAEYSNTAEDKKQPNKKIINDEDFLNDIYK